ncbi:hypothetical protein JQX13_14435 [Archangium violaceum]|uniref:hypothetical protein n=1 Tax=Archangium violaceum TaxID=83451 RepID=UPI00193C2427|nr:hypothetical protein [Archangium violaceum]QRK11159.1 hypothetical protein JQX13_14435 [Archangium violaceum]
MAHKLFRLGLPLGKQDTVIFNPKNEADQAALAALYKNNEEGPGGWYPIGLSQTWHNGIHLSSPDITTLVRSIAPGRIVAARLRMKGGEAPASPKEYRFGGPQFVLIRHELKVLENKCATERDPTKWTFRDVKFYSLYMHLHLPEASTRNIPWLTSFLPFLGPQPEADASGPSRQFVRIDVERDGYNKPFGLNFHGKPVKKKGGALSQGARLTILKKGTLLEVLTPTEEEAPFAELGYTKVKAPTEGNKEGWVRSDDKQLAPLPEFSAQVEALTKGGCARLDYPVSAGECIGLVGAVKPHGGMVHLEVFSEENLIEKDDLSQWHLFEGDKDDDPLCEIQGLPKELEPLAYNSSALLTSEQVKKAFTELGDTQRQFLRASITRNNSFWAVEWKDVKKNNEGWAKEFDLTDDDVKDATALMWWKEAKDAGVALPDKPFVYHYHPLALLEYLAARLPQAPLFYVERNGEEFIVVKPSELNKKEKEKVYVYDTGEDSWLLGIQEGKGIVRLWIHPGGQNLYELLVKGEAASHVPSLAADMKSVWASLWRSEGALSGVNTWDSSFLSFGPFQQTIGRDDEKGELSGALDYVKNHESGKELFKKYFQDHGFDVANVSGPQGMRTGQAVVDGKVLKTAADKELLREFIWAYRFVKAMRDPAFSKLFLEAGFKRLQLLRNLEHDFGNGQKFKLSQIHKSELAQALLLDAHINRPAFLSKADAPAALGEGLWIQPAKDVLGKLEKNPLGSAGFKLEHITAEHEFEMIKSIIQLRNKSSMTTPAKRAAFIVLCVQGFDANDDVAKACGYASRDDVVKKAEDKEAGQHKYGFLGRPPIIKKAAEEKKEAPAPVAAGG